MALYFFTVFFSFRFALTFGWHIVLTFFRFLMYLHELQSSFHTPGVSNNAGFLINV